MALSQEAISKLEVGQVFRNYPDLCAFLGETPVPNNNTNGRKAHEKELKRYFDWEKTGAGHALRISVIYDIPKNKVDERAKGNRSIYVSLIEDILSHELQRHGGIISESSGGLYHLLCMVNGRYDPEECSEKENNNIREFYVKDFYRRIGQKLYEVLMDALKNLKKREVIDYVEEYHIAKRVSAEKIESWVANEEEVEKIHEIESRVLKDMNLENKQQVAWQLKFKEFYGKEKKYLGLYDWSYIFFRYRITSTGKSVIIPDDVSQQRKSLNNLIVDFANKNARDNEKKEIPRRVKKANIDDEWGDPAAEFIMNRFYDFDYVEEQERLAEILLRI